MAFICNESSFPYIEKNSPGYKFSFGLLIFYPIFVFLSLVIFYCHRNTSVFLRKRSFVLLLASSVGSFLGYAVSCVYDIVGSQYFSCAGYSFLFYMAIPFMASPIAVKVTHYLSEVSARRVMKELNQELTADGSFEAFKAHMKVAFCKNRTTRVRILNARFSRSPKLLLWWLLFVNLPYLLAYFIRLGTDPVWNQNCFGCTLQIADFAFLIPTMALHSVSSYIINPLRTSRRDPLKIMRESQFAITSSTLIGTIAFILSFTDPGGVFMVAHQFNWSFFLLLAGFISINIQSNFQVWKARRMKHWILFSDDFNREDRFDDVLNDKDLKAELQVHLNRELSEEILMFLEAVTEFKQKFNIETSQQEAREIMRKHIEKNAPFEVNLPSDLREDMTRNFDTRELTT